MIDVKVKGRTETYALSLDRRATVLDLKHILLADYDLFEISSCSLGDRPLSDSDLLADVYSESGPEITVDDDVQSDSEHEIEDIDDAPDISDELMAIYYNQIDVTVARRSGSSVHRVSNNGAYTDLGISKDDTVYFCRKPVDVWQRALVSGIIPGTSLVVQFEPKVRKPKMITIVIGLYGKPKPFEVCVSQYALVSELRPFVERAVGKECKEMLFVSPSNDFMDESSSLYDSGISDGSSVRVYFANEAKYALCVSFLGQTHVFESEFSDESLMWMMGPLLRMTAQTEYLAIHGLTNELIDMGTCLGDMPSRLLPIKVMKDDKLFMVFDFIDNGIAGFEVHSEDTILSLKERICDKFGIPIVAQKFRHLGQSSNATLSQSSVEGGKFKLCNQDDLQSLHVHCYGNEYLCPMSPFETTLDVLYTTKRFEKRSIREMRVMLPPARVLNLDGPGGLLSVPDQSVIYVVPGDAKVITCETMVDGFASLPLVFESDLSVSQLKRMIIAIWNINGDVRLFLDHVLLDDATIVSDCGITDDSLLIVVPVPRRQSPE